MSVFRVEIMPQQSCSGAEAQLLASMREAGLVGLEGVWAARLFYLEGAIGRDDALRIATELLADPVTESANLLSEDESVAPSGPAGVACEIHPRPGVMDPVAESTLAELRAEGYPVEAVRTGRRYVFWGRIGPDDLLRTVGRVLANDCVEEVTLGTVGVRRSPRPPVSRFELRRVALRDLDPAALAQLSRRAHLFLSQDEMRVIQDHFRARGREPTDLELETLAQTWSEHCVHKTLRSAILYRGWPFPDPGTGQMPNRPTEERRYRNLLKDTIVRATEEVVKVGLGPTCLSVFKDNAGVVAFDERYGIAFKVETHNHPSAIEPYGGAATGIGGVIRDVLGCGLGAKPIADTDVFCVAPTDWPYQGLPKGVLHPGRVLRGVVRGVADYGNRMGIPTVNGAIYFDPRYLGNPLIFCGCVGLIPADRVEKAARPGDLILLIGGRTGRDGIHGATFSSAELTDSHAEEFSHAVQIGNPITEKRVLDAVLQARDAEGGCLYTAITDCGAGGLSSAVGEMGRAVGAVVDLEKVPLKYAGLRYDEIWISEAQERMVLAVPPENLDRLLRIMRDEEVEATVIGTFGHPDAGRGGAPRLTVRYNGQEVGDLEMSFLHGGLPQRQLTAEWWPTDTSLELPPAPPATPLITAELLGRLRLELARPCVASKEWVIRQYDHEVQGGSRIKPLMGPGSGPADAAVLCPRFDSLRGIAIGCGLVPHLADVDPYWMAAASIDEAVRNVVCVGGRLGQIAILDNFCWGRTEEPDQLGALVRACQACFDLARAYGVPFISGKDSLNNEFALDQADVEPLLAALERRAALPGTDAARLRAILPRLRQQLRTRRRLAIPPTLLISAVSILDDVRQCVTASLKRPGNRVILVGGLPQVGFAPPQARAVHEAVAELIGQGAVVACHDLADGGWLVALAEMAIGGDLGASLSEEHPAHLAPFEEATAGYLVETPDPELAAGVLDRLGVGHRTVAEVSLRPSLTLGGREIALDELRAAWAGRVGQGLVPIPASEGCP